MKKFNEYAVSTSNNESKINIEITESSNLQPQLRLNFQNKPPILFSHGSPMEEILSNYTQQAHDFYNRKDKQSDFNISLKIDQEEFKGLVQSTVKNDEFPSP